jgi:apolipoprotein N-acyltransferase
VLKYLPLATSGIIDAPLPTALPRPPYARYGELAFWLLISCATAMILWLKRQEE